MYSWYNFELMYFWISLCLTLVRIIEYSVYKWVDIVELKKILWFLNKIIEISVQHVLMSYQHTLEILCREIENLGLGPKNTKNSN